MFSNNKERNPLRNSIPCIHRVLRFCSGDAASLCIGKAHVTGSWYDATHHFRPAEIFHRFGRMQIPNTCTELFAAAVGHGCVDLVHSFLAASFWRLAADFTEDQSLRTEHPAITRALDKNDSKKTAAKQRFGDGSSSSHATAARSFNAWAAAASASCGNVGLSAPLFIAVAHNHAEVAKLLLHMWRMQALEDKDDSDEDGGDSNRNTNGDDSYLAKCSVFREAEHVAKRNLAFLLYYCACDATRRGYAETLTVILDEFDKLSDNFFPSEVQSSNNSNNNKKSMVPLWEVDHHPPGQGQIKTASAESPVNNFRVTGLVATHSQLPLHVAVLHRNVDMIIFLRNRDPHGLRYGSINGRNGWLAEHDTLMLHYATPLMLAMFCSPPKTRAVAPGPVPPPREFIEFLLQEFSLDIDAQDHLGRTAVLFGALTRSERNDEISVLLRHGARLDLAGARIEFDPTTGHFLAKSRVNPLLVAAGHGNWSLILLMLSHIRCQEERNKLLLSSVQQQNGNLSSTLDLLYFIITAHDGDADSIKIVKMVLAAAKAKEEQLKQQQPRKEPLDDDDDDDEQEQKEEQNGKVRFSMNSYLFGESVYQRRGNPNQLFSRLELAQKTGALDVAAEFQEALFGPNPSAEMLRWSSSSAMMAKSKSS